MRINREMIDALLASRRILVLGPCGSGKTVLTRQLGQILDLPAVHLDACFWRPGWVSTPQAEWRRRVGTLISQERWIMDGTYETTLDLRIPAADAIIMVSCSRWFSLYGVLRRSLFYRNRPRPDAPPDQPIDLAYLKYIWCYPARTGTQVNALIAEHGADLPVVSLNGRGGSEMLLSVLRQVAAGA
jgi:adenylate kinase family enzyme